MMNTVLTSALGLTLLLTPAAAATAVATRQSSLPFEIASLRGHTDPTLDSMRAGYVGAPAPLAAQERADLATAQQNSASLSELRGGGLSDKELTWLAIGAAVVLLIILI
ncbi:MAG: hypothetical protein ACKVXR_08265 [Planctomycetota bacterium]